MFFPSPDKTTSLDKEQVSYVPTTNTQYLMDATASLQGILELEFGFRDSLPAAAATFAAKFANALKVPTTSAMHIGTATGRGAFELSKLLCALYILKFIPEFTDISTETRPPLVPDS